ncbi:MAG: M23 family metallopeptidase [Bacteroidales bacterium]|nr:M23 family metallopeptidase [Bacteroidales bacterium]
MKKARKYILNPETLNYELTKISRSRVFARTTLLALGSVLMFFFYLWLYTDVFGLELVKTTLLKRKNAELLSKYELVSHKLDVYETALDALEMKDEDVYRSVFGMNSIPAAIRDEGLGGVNRYEDLDGFEHSALLKGEVTRLDMLTKKAYIQSKSFDEVGLMARRAGDMVSCIPAIPPFSPGANYHISSPFGRRVDPHYHYTKMHTGVDFSMKPGQRVYAVGDGVVSDVRFELFGYGHSVVIDHGFGYKTRYAHMKYISVAQGMKVKRGDCIGESGNTGKSTGPHLHFEVIYKGDHVNPMNYMDLEMPVSEYEQIVAHNETAGEYIHPSHRKKK